MAKVKSRDEKLQEKWLKFFKNKSTLIENENTLKELEDTYFKYKNNVIRPAINDILYQLVEDNIRPNILTKYKGNTEKIYDKILEEMEKSNTTDDYSFSRELRNSFYHISGKYLSDEQIYLLLNLKKRLLRYYKICEAYRKTCKSIKEEQTDFINPNENNNPKYITSLFIENFKGFSEVSDKEDNTVNIKPITLIYGPNSYGKSTILQSLLLLHQTIKYGGDYREVCLLPNGDLINLGSFQDFLNKHSKNKEISIEMSLPWEHNFIFPPEELFLYFHFTLKKNESGNDKIIMSQVDISSQKIDLSSSSDIKKGDKELLYSFVLKENGNNNLTYQIKDTNTEAEKTYFFSLKSSDSKIEQYTEYFNKLEKIIKNIIYVSSYRKPPQRYYIPENNPVGYVGKYGEYTSEIMYNNDVYKYVDIWLDKIVGYKLPPKKKNAKVDSIELNDNETKINKLNLLDLGSGVAQVLPIITQAFKSKNEMILIEEPEIHLHPRAQAELGSMFVDAVQKKNNTFIIETHSENLLLRLQRLIKNGELSKDDVSVIYVDKDRKGSYCIPLNINDNGHIENIDDVPDGFFEEGFNELFDIKKIIRGN